ncbi:MAG: hypothetical protein U5L96_04065 [Owenweeksia sp.]|nr:hypothetical protein [Owenweeksia sp.]
MPDNRNDAIPNDDTLQVSLNLLQPVSNLPYCVDFESGPELLGFSNGILDTLWKHDTPSKSNIAGAYSGSMAWTTGDSGTCRP